MSEPARPPCRLVTLIAIALIGWPCVVLARGSAAVLVDQGLRDRKLQWVATAPWRPDAVAAATARSVYWRPDGRRWRRLVAFTGEEGTTGPSICALGWARQGLLVGLARGLVVLETRGRRVLQRRVLLSGKPVRAMAVAPGGRRAWVAQGRWIWRSGRRGWTRIGRSPGGPWRLLSPHPTLRSSLLGSDGRAVYRSADGGRTWRRVPLGASLGTVLSGSFSLRGVRRGAASVVVLAGRSLLIRRSGRIRRWAGPRLPRRVLGARRTDGADWVVGNALFRRTGRQVRFQRISLGLRGGRVLDLASDWRHPRGLWCVTSGGVFRLVRRRLRPRRQVGCAWVPSGRATPLPRFRRADWLPRLSFRFRGSTRPRAHRAIWRQGPFFGRVRRSQVLGMITLDWPLGLTSTMASVSAHRTALVRTRYKRRERWRRIRQARCRHRRLHLTPVDPLWVERETTKALVHWADRRKESGIR